MLLVTAGAGADAGICADYIIMAVGSVSLIQLSNICVLQKMVMCICVRFCGASYRP